MRSVPVLEFRGREKRGVLSRFGDMIWRSDTLPTRFTLALCAAILAGASWTSGADCEYIGCRYLELVAPWRWWATAWSFYALLKFWRVIDSSRRQNLALVVNLLGAALYCTAAIVVTLARWPFLSLSAPAITFACASLWILLRTGINQGPGFRGD